jgi:hypothetical protein
LSMLEIFGINPRICHYLSHFRKFADNLR